MKTKFLTLIVLTLLLMVSCQSESDDGMDSESTFANEIPSHNIERFMEIIGNTKSNDNALNKSENNGNGVYIVPFYSDDGRWRAFFPIEGLKYMVLEFPQNGEDRALVFSETEMMVNFTSHDPQMYLYEFSTGQLYSNWCEPDASGLFKGRGKTGYVRPDWAPNAYFWGPFAPVEADDNYIFHIKATLHPTFVSHPCATVLDESIDFSYTLNGQNGKVKQTSSIK